MRSTQFDREALYERIREVMENELTPHQKQTVEAHYLQGKSIRQIARERRVHPSTVLRTLRRGETNIRRFLKYSTGIVKKP